ncbi:MAG: ABC transporter ATP-binding protein [Clostridiales bacterium]|jgi:putative ABC transport system ATP-binding protein|nr:ABC transporter ATP-binding protein [Clostridiales bacterium]
MDVLMRCENVKRSFRSGGIDFWALGGVDLEIEKGRLTILKGRSGSGKTTLVNILGALDYPTGGTVLFENRELTAMKESGRSAFRRKETGFVFQSVALVSMLTAAENVEFGLRVSGANRREYRRRAEECLQLVGLQGRMNHMAQDLSGGERQRAAIARAIAHRPRLILADEPTAELDTRTGLAVVKVFKDIIEKEGAAVVMTTHDPGLVEFADSLYELEDGVIVGRNLGNG